MSDKYILIGQTPVPCEDLFEWASLSDDNSSRRVLLTRVLDIVYVSTVFIGLNMRYVRGGRPLLFESMAFWRGGDCYEQKRCATWDEAEAMHWKMVREVTRPASVLAYVRRMASSAWKNARRDWKRSWRELRGIAPTDFERMMDQLPELIDERWE
jgi:hypothetical protein